MYDHEVLWRKFIEIRKDPIVRPDEIMLICNHQKRSPSRPYPGVDNNEMYGTLWEIVIIHADGKGGFLYVLGSNIVGKVNDIYVQGLWYKSRLS